MDAALAALLGTVVGTTASFGTMWIQQRHQTRRDRLKVAADLGLADYRQHVEHAKLKGGGVPPLSAYILYHAEFLDALAEGEITPDVIERLKEKQSSLLGHYDNPIKNSRPAQ